MDNNIPDTLDITSLEKAINSFKKALDELKKDDRSFIKDSVVQRFEYTYELCYKFFKRYLRIADRSDSDTDFVPIQELVRTANQMGMFKGDWGDWKKYREARNITSHTYDEDKAEEIVAVAQKFYEEAVYFENKLKEGLKVVENKSE